MAEFVRETGSNLTPIQHSNMIWRNTLKFNPLKGLFGAKDSGKAIVIDPTLKAKPGDVVRYHFVPFADQEPIRGQDATIKGNEYKFNQYHTSVTVDEVNFPFKKRGKMTDQRSILDVRAELTRQATQHITQYNVKQIHKVLTGGTVAEALSNLQSATNETDRVNGANRCIRASGTNSFATVTEALSDNKAIDALTLAATDQLNPNLILAAVAMVRTSSPYKMQPMTIGKDGQEKFCLLVHPYCKKDLMRHPEWMTRAISVSDAGIDDDPIAKGALGVLDNVIIKESEHVIVTTGSLSVNFAHNLLIGGDAAVLAWAQTTDYVEEWEDYRRELGVNVSEIRGEVKLAFTDKDAASADDTTKDIDYGVAQVIARCTLT